MDIKSLVLKTLKESGNPMKSAEIASKAGIDKAEVDKVIKTLKKEDRITSPKNCYYSPK
ncbi:MAG: MarR family transcriptional regulator [Bacteroidales bacterium]|jgi:DNA-binding IscR family transcriptional regulator|nr:MarR family transcriptional regulator [Bacteroidales bacterium]